MPEPNLAEAIGLQNKFSDNTPAIMQEGFRRRAEEDKVAADAKRAAKKRQADIEKNSANLSNWTLNAESGIHPIYQEKLASMAENMRQQFRDGMEADKENYSPAYDPELQKLKYEFKQEADKDRQSTKNIVRDIGIKASDAKGKYDINDKLYGALSTGSSAYADFVKENGGSDYYSMGLNTPKPEVLGWTKDAGLWASKMKGLYKKNPDGSKYIDPKAFEEQWAAIKSDPSAEWVQNADAVNKAHGLTDEQSEAQVKQYVLNLLPNQPAPDVSTGAGTGTKAKYEISNPYTSKEPVGGGDVNDFTNVTITKKGGGALPTDTYENRNKQSVVAKPTGKIYRNDKTGLVEMDIAVPDKSITSSSEWKDLDDAERQGWLDKKFAEDPNKFEIQRAPLDNNFNKNKFEASYGKTVNELFKGTGASSTQKSTAGKTIPTSKIKALVGTKGFEGYSEKELKDYYTSQGYTIK